MKVRYTAGPRARLTEFGLVERGEAVEVSDEIGKQLITQDWELVPSIQPAKHTPPVSTAAPKKEEK